MLNFEFYVHDCENNYVTRFILSMMSYGIRLQEVVILNKTKKQINSVVSNYIVSEG